MKKAIIFVAMLAMLLAGCTTGFQACKIAEPQKILYLDQDANLESLYIEVFEGEIKKIEYALWDNLINANRITFKKTDDGYELKNIQDTTFQLCTSGTDKIYTDKAEPVAEPDEESRVAKLIEEGLI